MKIFYKELGMEKEIAVLSEKFQNVYGTPPDIEITDLSVFKHIKFSAKLLNGKEAFVVEREDEQAIKLHVLKEYFSYIELLSCFPEN